MTFDADFLARLKQRDPATCTWFIFTFTPILEAMLRYKLRDHAAIEDVRNETFCRVLELLDKDRVREPERFGGFVRGVFSRVAQECIHGIGPFGPLPEDFEPPDHQPLIDNLMEQKELLVLLRNGLRKLSKEDRKLITESYLQGRARKEMARDRSISVVGLNVRICRALKRLRMMMLARI
jgi:RNA polymerase sigma-70 factor, ECF subfamily